MKRGWKILIIAIIILIALISFLRNTSPRQIDDISPLIPCEQQYIQKSETIWVIPNYKGFPISQNQDWCQQILAMNKQIGMHGIEHTYKEFKETKTQEQLEQGIQIFEECFGFKPTIFKAPHLTISKENKKLLEQNNIELKSYLNQISHKVYHCDDTGTLSNRFHDFF